MNPEIVPSNSNEYMALNSYSYPIFSLDSVRLIDTNLQHGNFVHKFIQRWTKFTIQHTSIIIYYSMVHQRKPLLTFN